MLKATFRRGKQRLFGGWKEIWQDCRQKLEKKTGGNFHLWEGSVISLNPLEETGRMDGE